MIHEDFYTGEPCDTGSPPISPNSEMEAANMASFGKYHYDPGARLMQQQQQAIITPGAYGYQTQPMMQFPPSYGLGSPYRYGVQVQPTYDMYRTPNYQYQQPQMTTIHIPGISRNGEYLPPTDFEKRIFELQQEYWSKQQDLEVKQAVETQAYYSPYGGNGYNYYGVPFFNPYQYNSLNAELSQKVQELMDEAKTMRKQFDMNLAKLAHKFGGDSLTEEQIEEMYNGKNVDIPTAVIPSFEEMQDSYRLQNMVPFDNTDFYRQQWVETSKKFAIEGVDQNTNMLDCFKSLGEVSANLMMDEEMHRRRNGSTRYDGSSYRYFVRKKAEERYAKEKGINIGGIQQPQFATPTQQQVLSQFPTLSKAASLADDGTLNITCNFGSHKGEIYSVHNSQEAEYNERKNSFYGAIGRSIYGNGG